MQLCNRSSQPIKPALQLSRFAERMPDGTRTVSAAVGSVVAAVADDEAIVKGRAELAAQRCVDVKVEASKVPPSSLLIATLRHGADELVEVKALRQEALPFNLKLDGSAANKLDITLVRGQRGHEIRLFNEDPVLYRIRWSLQLAGDEVDAGVAVAYPRQHVVLPVSLQKVEQSVFESGFVRAGERRGRLLLEHEPDSSFRLRPVEHKAFDVTARLSYWSPVWQGILNSIAILFFLCVGVLISLLVNYALPVQRKRIASKQRLADLEGRLAGLGGVISSRRLNLLRTEKKRLRDELRVNQWFHPSTEDALPKLDERIAALGRRIDLTTQAGALLVALRDDPGMALPEAERVEELCRSALDVAEKHEPDDSDMKAARAALDAAAKVLAGSDNPPGREAVTQLQAQARGLATAELARTGEWKRLADLMQALRGDFLADDEAEPTRERFVRAAHAVCKARLIIAFAKLVANAGGEEIRAKREGRGTDLLAALSPGPCESLRRATDIVREVEQNIDKADLIAELQRPGALRIEFDPRTPIGFQLVVFRLKLERPGFDTAVARQQIVCRWQFSGPGIPSDREPEPDDGWIVGQYFEPQPEPGLMQRWWSKLRRQPPPPPLPPFEVRAELLEDRDGGAPLATAAAKLRLEPIKSYGRDVALLASGTLVVTIGIVVIGLLAGAEDKIRSLDWWSAIVAIVVLGFSADTLKRILTKS
ncbi:MAG TPA: hypothetical protein VI032_18490 [Burkholderiaceae bacterium]